MITILAYLLMFSTNGSYMIYEDYSSDYVRPYYTLVFDVDGTLQYVKVDTKAYPNLACDSWDKTDDNGHNCALVGTDMITEFFKAKPLPYASIFNNIT